MPGYQRKLPKLSVEEVLSAVVDKLPPKPSNPRYTVNKVRHLFDGDLVGVSSVRLQTFKKMGVVCAECGVTGSFFVKQRTDPNSGYHLCLYAIDKKGKEVLMTKDHVQPKSLGGSDKVENMRPCCEPCNSRRGNTLL